MDTIPIHDVNDVMMCCVNDETLLKSEYKDHY